MPLYKIYLSTYATIEIQSKNSELAAEEATRLYMKSTEPFNIFEPIIYGIEELGAESDKQNST